MKFDTFSAQAFERLVQSLSAQIFGPGTIIFGSGRDGGREATYQGTLPTFEGRGWSGYTVIQAKCREKPLHDGRDASWLCGQLNQELQKYIDNSDLERPEYYLMCTNVELSSVPENGGRAKIDTVFRAFADRLGIRDWHVWTADDLRSLLEAAPGVRTSYAAWLTPSDILTILVDKLIGADVNRLLPLALARDLRSEREVRLRDAGQETQQPIFFRKCVHRFANRVVSVPVHSCGVY